MVQLQKDINKLAKRNIQIVGISYDAVDKLAKFSKQKKISFRLLSDPKGNAIRAYGVLNKQILKEYGFPAAIPGTFIVDNKQVIRAKLFFKNYRKRHDGTAIIQSVSAQDRPKRKK